MRGNRFWLSALALAIAVLHCAPGFAQAIVSEDFTGATTNNAWYYFNGACLTASTSDGTGVAGSVAGTPPGCTTLQGYYDDTSNGRSDSGLVGGYYGTATSLTNWNSSTPLDPVGDGALRFTNGCIYSNGCGSGGYKENGLIISGKTYDTDQGLDITFKTVTYDGDSYGNGASCPSGTTAYNGDCVDTAAATAASYTCPSGYTMSGSGSNTVCTTTYAATYYWGSYRCNRGDTLSGETCTHTISATANSYTCQSGYTLSGSTCYSNTPVQTDPNQNDGADGMSFFLMDGSQPVTFSDGTGNYGSWGGSLGYSCSNSNSPYNGLVGGYIGLGIDEYGNFLNPGDNTASGPGLQANRIGLRGAGNVSWYWLNDHYKTQYPDALATTLESDGTPYSYWAVEDTCRSGTLWDFSNGDNPYQAPSTDNTNQTSINGGPTLEDYAEIPNAYTVLDGSVKIANEYANGGYSRQPYSTTSGTYGTGANPITYDLKITANGLLSLSYSYNGGAWTSVIKNQSITASNGTLPDTVRFGFAGSTGGATNIHEIMCFKAAPASQAASSTTVNQQQSSKVEDGSQAYFGYYDPQNWAGALTANELVNTNGVLTIDATANWDASCVLTGATTCATTGQTGLTAQSWQTGNGGRVILTWSGSQGIPLEFNDLTSSEQSALDAGDSSQTADRLQFLRGDQQEQIQNGGTFRNLDSTLGDIVDSSSAWVGPPSKSVYSAYETPMTWKDKLYPTASMPENSGQSYTSYVTAEAQRLNVVYVGANDGMLHGFSAGSYDSTGTVYNTSTNTGQEVLAYMPQGVLDTIHNALTPSIDYANPQYGHNFYVDATPGTGDLYYGNQWHSWLVGGLGPGGSEIYALDITNPANFSETNASSLVMGDWQGGTSATTNPGSFTCQNVADCALDLGDTYGTPTVRLLHNGDWAVIFGNGLNSSTGDAGIYILTIDPSATQSNGLPVEKMYYLSTGETGNSDGIAYAHPVDMDGDHVVDYVYAGDTLGNVWRFNLTSSDPANWHAGSAPLFTTATGQPITSDVYPAFVAGPAGTQLMLFFGTGRKFPITETSGTSYTAGQQSFYGVWDWNMSTWNAYNSTQFASLPAGTAGTLGPSNLQQQTVTYDSGLPSIDTPYSVCWAGGTTCSAATLAAKTSATSSNNQYGWYINFPGTNSGYGSTTYEQEIYNPILVSTAIQFNSILPAIDSPLMCTPDYDEGWSYALDVRDGNPIPGFFVNNGNTKTIALQTNASGSSSEVTTTNGSGNTDYYLIYQSTTGGAGTPTQIQPANNITGYRETWVQLR
jgi:type IV pilus assembly protein PilY1